MNITLEEFINLYGDSISIEWRIGGMTGGNCWGDCPEWPVTADPEPEFEMIDKILEKYLPNISYLDYKKLASLIKYDEHTEREYYGNYTEYAIKTINGVELYNFIKSKLET